MSRGFKVVFRFCLLSMVYRVMYRMVHRVMTAMFNGVMYGVVDLGKGSRGCQ